MTIFKSRQVNTDPAPWRNPNDGERRSHGVKWVSGPDVLDPRPEFNVTRDPRPWDASRSRPSSLGQIREWRRFASHAEAERWGQVVEFDPRPEFAHPVNRILVALRKWEIPAELAIQTLNGYSLAYDHIDDWCDEWEFLVTPDEIDHARRVLTRLANMKEPSNG